MNRPSIAALVAGASLGAAALPALAVTCYEVIDRTNSVLFRDIRTPIDLSDAGARARDAMRNRGEQLIIFEAENCIVLGRITPTGAKTLTVDEIVADFQPFAGPSAWGTWVGRMGGPRAPGLSSASTPSRGSSSGGYR